MFIVPSASPSRAEVLPMATDEELCRVENNLSSDLSSGNSLLKLFCTAAGAAVPQRRRPVSDGCRRGVAQLWQQ